MAGRRDSHGPEPIAELIPQVLDEAGLADASRAVQLLRIWDEALGPELASHCRPVGLSRGVIRARARDSSWMQRIQMEKPRILERLRSALGDPPPQDLRLRIGPVD